MIETKKKLAHVPRKEIQKEGRTLLNQNLKTLLIMLLQKFHMKQQKPEIMKYMKCFSVTIVYTRIGQKIT